MATTEQQYKDLVEILRKVLELYDEYSKPTTPPVLVNLVSQLRSWLTQYDADNN